MEQTSTAAFSLARYSIVDFMYADPELNGANTMSKLSVTIIPNGMFDLTTYRYNLSLLCVLFVKETKFEVVKANIIAEFEFDGGVKKVEEIPPFFYANSIAIIFPYVRAFISTLTLQANVSPIILPTLNLSKLAKPLQENTVTSEQVREMHEESIKKNVK